MRIENEQKLDYSNVLIRPKRSTAGSRKEVELKRKFTFKYANAAEKHSYKSEYDYVGIPIIASNMDGVGTFDMGDTLAKLGLMTCLVKTYSVSQLVNYYDDRLEDFEYRKNNVIYSMGISDSDYEKFKKVYDQTDNNIN